MSVRDHTSPTRPSGDLRPAEPVPGRYGDRLPFADLGPAGDEAAPWVGDEALFERFAAVLFRSQRRHVALTGLPGVGKTSAARAFASLIQSGRWPFLAGRRCLEVDGSCVGPEDSRAVLEMLVAAAESSVPVLLVVDGLAPLLRRAGGGSNGPLLRALLGRRHVSVLATLSPWEYADLVAPDAALAAHFGRVELPEPREARAREVLLAHAGRLGAELGLSVSPELVARAQHLCGLYLLSEYEPARTLRVLREAAESVLYRNLGSAAPRRSLDPDDVVGVLAERTGIPPETVAGRRAAGDFEAALAADVFGQDAAVREVAAELRLIKAGLSDAGKPATVLLFAGLTGVGKTELAKRVAEVYSSGRRPQLYSMGNFTEPHSVSGIVGVPPGYVGHEQGGRIVNELLADPYSVFLLDEAEKAHPNVWKPFLNLFDEGWVVDQRGVKAHADRAIFVLTTNAGDRHIAQLTKTGADPAALAEAVRSALAKVRHERSTQPVFPPQFLARIQRVVVFRPLDQGALTAIARRRLERLAAAWERKLGLALEVAPEVPELLGRLAHERSLAGQHQEGGRLVHKLVARHLQDRLQAEVLAGAGEGPPAARRVRVACPGHGSVTEETLSAALEITVSSLGDDRP